MSYHNRVMNLAVRFGRHTNPDWHQGYDNGHRDARHAAAEIATEADTEIEKYRKLLAKALPLIEAEAKRRDDAFMSDSAIMETEQSTIHYWTEMRELADEIAKKKGVE